MHISESPAEPAYGGRSLENVTSTVMLGVTIEETTMPNTLLRSTEQSGNSSDLFARIRNQLPALSCPTEQRQVLERVAVLSELIRERLAPTKCPVANIAE